MLNRSGSEVKRHFDAVQAEQEIDDAGIDDEAGQDRDQPVEARLRARSPRSGCRSSRRSPTAVATRSCATISIWRGVSEDRHGAIMALSIAAFSLRATGARHAGRAAAASACVDRRQHLRGDSSSRHWLWLSRRRSQPSCWHGRHGQRVLHQPDIAARSGSCRPPPRPDRGRRPATVPTGADRSARRARPSARRSRPRDASPRCPDRHRPRAPRISAASSGQDSAPSSRSHLGLPGPDAVEIAARRSPGPPVATTASPRAASAAASARQPSSVQRL